MPRRNDISKILIIGSGPIVTVQRLLGIVLFSAISLNACEPTRQAYQRVPPRFVITVALRDGQPLSGSTIVITQAGTYKTVRTKKTDRHGHIYIQTLPAGDYLVSSSEWPLRTWWREILVDPETREAPKVVIIEIPRPKTIRLASVEGIVLDPGGAPMQAARIEVEKPRQQGKVVAWTFSDGNGRFVSALPKGDYTLRVSSPTGDMHAAVIPVHVDQTDSAAWPGFRLTMKTRSSECAEQWNPYAYDIASGK
jgi:Carboxypeptidase regulatory-like domain